MKKFISVLTIALIFGLSTTLFAGNFFKDLKSLISSKTKAKPKIETKTVWFTVYLTNGKTIECLDAKSPYNRNAIKVLTDYEATTKIQLKYVKYVDFSKTNKNILENEWENTENDIIHLVNSDIISGNILGFGGDSIRVETPYGTHDILLKGVDYVILRSRSVMIEKPVQKEEESEPKEEK